MTVIDRKALARLQMALWHLGAAQSRAAEILGGSLVGEPIKDSMESALTYARNAVADLEALEAEITREGR